MHVEQACTADRHVEQGAPPAGIESKEARLQHATDIVSARNYDQRKSRSKQEDMGSKLS